MNRFQISNQNILVERSKWRNPYLVEDDKVLKSARGGFRTLDLRMSQVRVPEALAPKLESPMSAAL
jgi:hypothetical protein